MIQRLGVAATLLALAAPTFAREAMPGAPDRSQALETRLEEALAALGPGYVPRTRHKGAGGAPRWSNRLLLESSPYLRQHAHNPVDWHPWGDEAFEAARRLGRPVLLSIGYSTCHWCHVMEEESFEDPELARLLNQRYVAVKVDREERPDVDAVYLGSVQMLTGGNGGWPLTVWLTADRRPFYGATYLPLEDGARGVRIGFRTLLERLADAFAEEPGQIEASAARVVEGLASALDAGGAGDAPGRERIGEAIDRISATFDRRSGGRLGRQKFPGGVPLRLLLLEHTRSGASEPLEMALLTLERMRDGGLRDHVGGGFHRYTVDAEWRVPHFEKMLYDNALLAGSYLEAGRITGRDDLKAVAREIFAWADREMSHPEGGFYSATDADSLAPGGEREEGRFFTWTPQELEAALGAETARLVADRYGVDAAGRLEGRSVLSVTRDVETLAAERGETREATAAALAAALERLAGVRAARPPPLRDEKIIAGWNGLMIGALAQGALTLGEPALARRAERAAGFVLDRMRSGQGLRRSWAGGDAAHAAVLGDYAFLVAGLIDLYQATGGARWIDAAIELEAFMQRELEDVARGGFFTTAASGEKLLVRPRGIYDAALPSGNGVHVASLARLAVLTGDDAYRRRAEATLAGFAEALERAPEAAATALLGLDLLRSDPREIVIVAPTSREEAEPFLAEVRRRHLPEAVLLVAVEGPDLEEQARRVPVLEEKRALGGRATAYLCRRGVCRLPTTDPDRLAEQLDAERQPASGGRAPAAPPPPRAPEAAARTPA